MNTFNRIELSQGIRFFKVIAFILTSLLVFYYPDAFANENFIKKLPSEIDDVESAGMLGTLLNLFILGAAIIVGAGLLGVPIMTLKIVLSTLNDISEGRSSYAKLFIAVIVGIIVELVLIGFIYFAWDYILAARDILG